MDETNENHSKTMTLKFLEIFWLDEHFNKDNDSFLNNINQWTDPMTPIMTFFTVDECVDCITESNTKYIFLIVAGKISVELVPLIQNIPNLHKIFIFTGDQNSSSSTSLSGKKIAGDYTSVSSLFEELHLAIKRCYRMTEPFNIIKPIDDMFNINENQIEPSFMYTKLIVKFLHDMEHNEQSRTDFVNYFRGMCAKSKIETELLDEFERTYDPANAAKLYTAESFIYKKLNESLRFLDCNTLLSMGFFIKDLHCQISDLHQKQKAKYKGKSFCVYRGQQLLPNHLEKLKQTKNGLISFNSFLSTSKGEEVPITMAESTADSSDNYGILFVIKVDPNLDNVVFADVSELSRFGSTEDEILFSMHTIFRIEDVQKHKNYDRVYRVHLSLTADNDEKLNKLTQYFEKDLNNLSLRKRIAHLLLDLKQPDMIEKLFNPNDSSQNDPLSVIESHYYCALLRASQNRIPDAERHLSEAVKIINNNKNFANDSVFPFIYMKLGMIKLSEQKFQPALDYFQEALKMEQAIDGKDSKILMGLYHNIGIAQSQLGEYEKAHEAFKMCMEQMNILPPDHPVRADIYCNVAGLYMETRNYEDASDYLNKSIQVRQYSLPTDHPSFAVLYNTIGILRQNLGLYEEAISYLKKAQKIIEKYPDIDQCWFSTFKRNLAVLYGKIGDYQKALSIELECKRQLEMSHGENHHSLAILYSSIGSTYTNLTLYEEAIEYFQKSRRIHKKESRADFLSLSTLLSNTGLAYLHIGKSSEAIQFFEESLQVAKQNHSNDHESFITTYNNLGRVYQDKEEYTTAHVYYKEAMESAKKYLPENHPTLGSVYNNIGTMYAHLKKYRKALTYLMKSFEIQQGNTSANKYHFGKTCKIIALMHLALGEKIKASEFANKALDIQMSAEAPDPEQLNDLLKIIYSLE